MALPLEELETATREHFMPVVTNQIFKVSPVLWRIFKMAQEGQYGLALPKLQNWATKIHFDTGKAEIANPRQAGI